MHIVLCMQSRKPRQSIRNYLGILNLLLPFQVQEAVCTYMKDNNFFFSFQFKMRKKKQNQEKVLNDKLKRRPHIFTFLQCMMSQAEKIRKPRVIVFIPNLFSVFYFRNLFNNKIFITKNEFRFDSTSVFDESCLQEKFKPTVSTSIS